MEKFPELPLSFAELYALVLAPIKTKILLTGIELKVFDHLCEPVPAETVAAAIDSHPLNTQYFLDGLATMGLVEKKNGGYQNALAAQTFLVEGKLTYLGHVFAYHWTSEPNALDDLSRLVKEGPPSSPKAYTASDEMPDAGVLSYVNIERSGRAQMIARIASHLPEFPAFQKMLDLGCGPGLNGIAIVAAHPTMQGVSFDRSRTIKVTEKSVKEYAMEDRMTVLGGDYVQDSIGEGYDLVLASDTLYYNQNDMAVIMEKIHAALNPGGVFLSFHVGLTHERTKPEGFVLGGMLAGLMGEDMGLLDQGFLADAMLQAGFKSVRSRTLTGDWAPMDLDIGRK
jgi:SAM-dependent methyltransferase